MLTMKQATLAVMTVWMIAAVTPIAARAADYLSLAGGLYDGIRRLEDAGAIWVGIPFRDCRIFRPANARRFRDEQRGVVCLRRIEL